MNNSIPIILLHHNEPDNLILCLDSIVNRTDYPHNIIVVDNNSSISNKEFDKLLSKYSITLLRNNKNNWIYGFNLGLKHLNSNFYALSDADIIVPERNNGICWLSHLVTQLNSHIMIGKLGLSLDLSDISKIHNLSNVYKNELKYKSGYKIGDNVIAPVDSTMAIYRNDLFITKFKMQIGHMRLIRPYYYCARSSDDFKCTHLGWAKYEKASSNIQDGIQLDYLKSKANFFGKFGITLPEDLYNLLPYHIRLKYKITCYCIRALHLFKLYIYWFLYIIFSGVGKLNKIQAN